MEVFMTFLRHIMELHRRFEKNFWRILAKRGPYRFAINRWNSLIDINLATRIMDSEYFRGELNPLPLSLSKVSSIFIIAPHQDDESIGAGGTLLLAAKTGTRINVLHVTDGLQRDRRESENEYMQIRHTEAEKACSYFSGIIDRLGISNIRPKPSILDIDRLSNLICRLQPDVLMLPWLLDVPPKHRLANHLLWLANKHKCLPECEVWAYQVHNTLYPNGYVDITDVAEQKRDMIRCFRSQNEHYKHYDSIAMGLAAWNARLIPARLNEGRDRFAEIFFVLPITDYLNLVENFYFHNLNYTYGNDIELLDGAQSVHQQVTGYNLPASL
jgi:LmbE family N-acetylglucosaminyl deacetylase